MESARGTFALGGSPAGERRDDRVEGRRRTHVGFAKATRDLTERRTAEERLRRMNEELEKRVRDRTAALEAANKELELS